MSQRTILWSEILRSLVRGSPSESKLLGLQLDVEDHFPERAVKTRKMGSSGSANHAIFTNNKRLGDKINLVPEDLTR